VDTFTFSFLLSGQENGGEVQHRARTVVMQGQHLLAPMACIAGDLDCNCRVDIVDIMLVAVRWRSQVGDELYDPLYDLDNDGDIDIVDIMLAVVHWGERCGT